MANNNSFIAAANGFNKFSRKFGTEGNSVDPYITGYHFVKFNLPQNVYYVANTKKPGMFGNGLADINNLLASLCLSVNIPGRTVNKVENIGLGGIRWSAPSNVDEDNTISVRFLETQDIPIHTIFSAWVRLIRDNRSGVSLLRTNQPVSSNSSYTKANYSGSLYYWTTTPNGMDVQFSSCYTGIFPMKDPSDLFGHDLAANDRLEIDIDFSTDYCWMENWVRQKCLQFSNDYSSTVFNSTSATSEQTGVIPDNYKPSDANN